MPKSKLNSCIKTNDKLNDDLGETNQLSKQALQNSPSQNLECDIAIIGGGPGGYPAAIKAAQNGLSTILIETNELGGTCLNRGCIPTKALIAHAEIWHRLQNTNQFGINVKEASFDFNKMTERKNQVVGNLTKGIAGLIASNKIKLLKGFGKFISPREIKVTGQDNAIVKASKTIIATGSEPRNIEAFPFDHQRIHSSTSILDLKTLPKSLVIIGAGIIGCEFASLYQTLGVKVILIELLSTILATEDKLISDFMTRSFKKRGIEIYNEALVKKIEPTKSGVNVKLASGKDIEAELALVAVGRTLNTNNIGLDKAGVLVQDNGIVSVNAKMETNVAGIYAVGDIASKWWLAHVATHQGIVAANNASGIDAKMHYNAIPSAIFTHPEVATVGMTLDQANKAGFQATTGAFPFQALGKSQATGQTEGFSQIVFDKKTGQILGAQVIGAEASTLIAEIAIAISNELTIESISETIHAHPTLSEAWLEAALMGQGMPLHLPPK